AEMEDSRADHYCSCRIAGHCYSLSMRVLMRFRFGLLDPAFHQHPRGSVPELRRLSLTSTLRWGKTRPKSRISDCQSPYRTDWAKWGNPYEYHASRLPRSDWVDRRDQLPPWVAQRQLDCAAQQLSLARPPPNAGNSRVARHLQPHASHRLRGAQSRQNL